MDEITRALEPVLPNKQWKIAYVQLNPVRVKPLVHCPAGAPKPDLIKIRHFFEVLTTDNVIVMGIEVFVYLQIYPDHFDQYLFVPKCDTVGLVELGIVVGKVVQALLTWVMQYPPTRYQIPVRVQKNISEPSGAKDHLPETVYRVRQLQRAFRANPSLAVDKRVGATMSAGAPLVTLPPARCVKVALFTKSAPLYLYPHLDRNRHKRVASGAQLLKWWVRVIAGVTLGEWHRVVDIPGAEPSEVTRYLPPDWEHGHIFGGAGAAVYNVALFPDDPKGRFLEHLIVEGRAPHVDSAKFYHELGFRQEFRLGDVVGLVGAVSPTTPVDNTPLPATVATLGIAAYKKFIRDTKLIDYSAAATAAADSAAVLRDNNVAVHTVTGKCAAIAAPVARIGAVRDLTANVRKRTPTTSSGAHDLTAMVRKKAKK